MKAKLAILLRNAPKRVRERIGKNPTASATSSPKWASCSKTPRTAPPGRSRDDPAHAAGARHAPNAAGGCAGAGGDFPRQHRGADGRRLQRGAAGGVAIGR